MAAQMTQMHKIGLEELHILCILCPRIWYICPHIPAHIRQGLPVHISPAAGASCECWCPLLQPVSVTDGLIEVMAVGGSLHMAAIHTTQAKGGKRERGGFKSLLSYCSSAVLFWGFRAWLLPAPISITRAPGMASIHASFRHLTGGGIAGCLMTCHITPNGP